MNGSYIPEVPQSSLLDLRPSPTTKRVAPETVRVVRGIDGQTGCAKGGQDRRGEKKSCETVGVMVLV